MKKVIALFLFLVLLIEPVFASEFVPSSENLSKKKLLNEKIEYLSSTYDKVDYIKNIGFIVEKKITDPEDKRSYLFGLYDEDLNVIVDINDGAYVKLLVDKEHDSIIIEVMYPFLANRKKFQRYAVVIKDGKYTLYDGHQRKLSDITYDNIYASIGRTPIVKSDGKYYKIQPVKNAFNSTFYIGRTIILDTVALPVTVSFVLSFILFSIANAIW